MRNYWGLGVGHIYSHGESSGVSMDRQWPEENDKEHETETQNGDSGICQTPDEIEENAENRMGDEEMDMWNDSGAEDSDNKDILSGQDEESDEEFLELHDTYSPV